MARACTTVGKGTVYAGQSLTDVFDALKVAPDFDYTKPESDTRLLFVHRRLADGDLYFVDNRNDRDETVDATFRVTGKAPELWHAETGKAEPASYKIADGRTTVPLHLEPWGTVFVVFRKPTKATSRTLPKMVETGLATVEGAWNVSFQPGRGAPASITLDKLISWSDSTDAGVKYFSGAGNLHQDDSGFARLVQEGREAVDRSGRREEPGGGDGEWQIARHRLACALPRGCHQRVKAGRERSDDQGDQCVGQPADRRSAARCHDEVHVRGREALQGELAVAALGTSWARAPLFCCPRVAGIRNGQRLEGVDLVVRGASMVVTCSYRCVEALVAGGILSRVSEVGSGH